MGLVMAADFKRDQMVLLVAGHIVGMRHAAGDVDFAGDSIDQFRSRLMDRVFVLPKLFPFRSARVSRSRPDQPRAPVSVADVVLDVVRGDRWVWCRWSHHRIRVDAHGADMARHGLGYRRCDYESSALRACRE